MLTAIDDDETVLESIQAGADGYLTKDRAVEDVVATVRAGGAGGRLPPRAGVIGTGGARRTRHKAPRRGGCRRARPGGAGGRDAAPQVGDHRDRPAGRDGPR